MTNQSRVAGKRSFRAVLAIVIAIVVLVSICTSTAFADSFVQYDVTVIDGASENTITTNETEPIEILKAAGIPLNSKDKLNLSEFVSGEGGKIAISRYNTINVDFDNNVQTYSVYGATVGEALKEVGITVGERDEVNYSFTDPVIDGMVIDIKSAFSVTLNQSGKKTKYAIVEGTVADLLKLANVKLGKNDYTEPSLDTALEADMTVKVNRVQYKTRTKKKTIEFTTKTIEDDTMPEGTEEVVTEGVNGEKEISYRIKYVNSKATRKDKLREKVTKQPTQKVVKVGTMKQPGADATPNGVKEMNGYKLGQVISGRYTHYCACATCNGNSNGITTSGKRISNGMKNPYYIACNWLPLGSVVNVDGVNYTVVDRGGSGLSRVGRIDIFTPEGHSACYRYGTGSCTLTIVRLGW